MLPQQPFKSCKNSALQPMEISKRYNAVPVKDYCALFAPTPHIFGPGYPTVSFKFLPCRPLLPWQQIILGQKLTTTRPSWKIIARCFHLHPYFQARAIRWRHLDFSSADPVAMTTNFETKWTITRLPQKIIARCFHLPPIFVPGLCNGAM